MFDAAFREIAHSGGKITIEVRDDPARGRGYALRIEHCRPNPASWWAIYAVQPGIPAATIRLGGIGDPWNPPPVPNAFPVFLGSDSEGCFGRMCPECGGYWRNRGYSIEQKLFCPYCGSRFDAHTALTDSQRRYLAEYADKFEEAVTNSEPVDYVIDLDAIADAVSSTEKPPFYYAEEGQQHQFNCIACGEFNDVLGHVAYCSVCGSRNDEEVLKGRLAPIRQRVHTNQDLASCLRDVVSAFDGAATHLIDQLVNRIPMRPRTRQLLVSGAKHQLDKVAEALRVAFNIDLYEGLSSQEAAFCRYMFYRRHVHEHNAGIVDDEYLSNSGDTTVRLGQALVETAHEVQQLSQHIVRMTANIVAALHEIFPPAEDPIRTYQQRRARS